MIWFWLKPGGLIKVYIIALKVNLASSSPSLPFLRHSDNYALEKYICKCNLNCRFET